MCSSLRGGTVWQPIAQVCACKVHTFTSLGILESWAPSYYKNVKLRLLLCFSHSTPGDLPASLSFLLWNFHMVATLAFVQVILSPASPGRSRNTMRNSDCQAPLCVPADESSWAHAFEALYQNLLLPLTDLHTTMVCLICFFIKSIMGLIEKIGSATCNLTTDLNVCLRKATMLHRSASATCVTGALCD